jgi:hypothetical protein
MRTSKPSFGYIAIIVVLLFGAYKATASMITTAVIKDHYETFAIARTAEANVLLQDKQHLVLTTADRGRLQTSMTALVRQSALPGEAARSTRTLHVVMVHAPRDSGAWTRMALDIESLSTASVLLIADEPTHWEIKGATAHHRGKIAIESRAPVTASGTRQGLFAGLRIQGFDIWTAIGPDSLKSERQTFCEGIAAWRKLFNLSADHVDLWAIHSRDQPTIVANDSGIIGAERIDELKLLCK